MSTVAVQEFRAMGTTCNVRVYATAAADDLASIAALRVELLEQSWSRFRESSELNRLNARAGLGAVEVSGDLLSLVWHMRRAWELTGGLFDPTVLEAIKAAGYDVDFATVIARDALAQPGQWAAPLRTTGMADIVIDMDASTVTLPTGVGLDPGAIGKGLAADIIANELIAAGALGVLVDIGGDIVMAGQPGDDGLWSIDVQDERLVDGSHGADRVVTFPPSDGTSAIATSSTLRRRWAGGTRHHVIDPRTGQVAQPELVQATVWCGAGWLAEASATAALLMDAATADEWLTQHEAGFLLMTASSTYSSMMATAHE